MGRFDHLKKVHEHFGTPAAMLRIGDRILQAAGVEVHKVMWQDGRSYEKVFTPDSRFAFRQVTPDEVELIAGDSENRLPLSFVERARSGRHLCFATFCQSRLAAYAWYAPGTIDADQNAGVPMSYPDDTACVYRAFTHPEFRGQLVHAGIRPQLLAALAHHGITKLVALVSWTNWPSLRYCQRVGYRDIGYLLSMGPRQSRRWIGPREAAACGIRFGNRDNQAGDRQSTG
jgi:hypothetical protein